MASHTYRAEVMKTPNKETISRDWLASPFSIPRKKPANIRIYFKKPRKVEITGKKSDKMKISAKTLNNNWSDPGLARGWGGDWYHILPPSPGRATSPGCWVRGTSSCTLWRWAGWTPPGSSSSENRKSWLMLFRTGGQQPGPDRATAQWKLVRCSLIIIQ